MSIPYFDAHCDTITRGEPLRRNGCHLDLERLCAYSPCAQVFAIWIAPSQKPRLGRKYAAAPREYDKYLAALLREFQENSDIISHCRNAADAKKAADEGKIAAFVSIEGADMLKCSIDRLRIAHFLGARMLHLTWNDDNALAGAAMGEDKYGLTMLGKRFVKVAQKLGMLLDMSHISDDAFSDVMALAKRPVVAGHSNSRALCPHPRNITDEQFAALVKTGGGAGINLCRDFLGLGMDIDAVLAHMEHFLALGGEKAVFLGGDLDGISQPPDGIDGVQDMGRVYEAMLRRNWSEELVRDIFYNNFMDILERAL